MLAAGIAPGRGIRSTIELPGAPRSKDLLLSVEIVLAVVASSFGVVMGLAPTLQIRRMLRERSSRDVSTGYFAIIAFGSVLWASYGVSIGSTALVIPNVVGFLSSSMTMLVAHRLRRQERFTVRVVDTSALNDISQ